MIANFVTPLFGGIPATGTIARTVTNVKSGAVSPIAGIIHSLTLLAIVLIAAPLAANIPLAVLAAILMLVAWNMGEWHEFARLKNFPVTYRTILLATFFLTVIFDITVAVQVGLILASLFFIYRISQITRIEPVALAPAEARPRVEAYRLFGSLFFGAVSKLEAINDPARYAGAHAPRVIVFDLALLISLDTTGVDALDSVAPAACQARRHIDPRRPARAALVDAGALRLHRKSRRRQHRSRYAGRAARATLVRKRLNCHD